MKKHTIFLVLAAALMAIPARGDKTYNYFKAVIRGQHVEAFPDGPKLSGTGVQQKRVEVWKAWTRALRRVEADTLRSMTGDSITFTGKWRLPPELENDATLNFTYLSKGQRPSTGYPLYIYLHGSGPKDVEYNTGIKFARSFDDAPSVYFVPQIPNEGGYYRWWQRAKVWAWQKLLRLTMASGYINPDKIYFTGISEGAYGTQRLTAYFADYLAGGGAMAGGEPLRNAPAVNCANTAFLLYTGAADQGFDRNKLTQYTLEAFDSLARAHDSLYIHSIRLLRGQGHGIDYSVATPWLKTHTRNPYPKYVAWEDFAMDGCRRVGFYNIYVGPHSDDESTRTLYEEQIHGDTIDMRVSTVEYTTTEKDKLWGLELKFARKCTPATTGSFTLFLSPDLMDLNRPVTVTVNGKTAYSGKVVENMGSMVRSLAAYGDPRRIYSAEVNISF